MNNVEAAEDLAVHSEPPDFLSTGLTEKQARLLLQQIGKNTLALPPKLPILKTFIANFTHMMALLLWAGGFAAFLAQLPQVGLAIWAVNLINGSFSFWQEYQAEKATEALLTILPSYAQAIRDGVTCKVGADELVPGDLIVITEGDRVPADAKLCAVFSLTIDESVLTGESQPVKKSQPGDVSKADGYEAENMVFAGTTVAAGHGKAIVSATGMKTAFGKIAHLTQSIAELPSPLQVELANVTKLVTVLAVSIGLLFFGLAICVARVHLTDGFIFAMGMIVAFVPEGMVPTVTFSLALGVREMAARNALIKRLSSVETLGCTTVICTDKTGTITKNEMTVHRVWTLDSEWETTGKGYCPEGEIREITSGESFNSMPESVMKELLIVGVRCNNATLNAPTKEQSRWLVLGDPTEAALLTIARKAGLLQLESCPRVREQPFDSVKKRMIVVCRSGDRHILYAKGAVTSILDICSSVMSKTGARSLDQALKEKIMQAHDSYARQGLRVLALAERVIADPFSSDCQASLEGDLTFLGLTAMLDPPHDEIPDAVKKCQAAGIKIVMITGDYELTAESIAVQVGLAKPGVRVITGPQLDSIDSTSLLGLLKDPVIFARVTPHHKLRIVTAFQELGHVVAVTGDGVNDAPALKKADIGIAMGIAGSDVAKEAADMILTDDNFASIVGAVELGRAVYANIRKFAVYVFNSNMAEAVPFIVMLFSAGLIPLPLTIMQVLAIDLGTDMVPAIGLGADKARAELMSAPPRNRKERLLTVGLLSRALLFYGLIEAVAGMSCYFFVNWQAGWPQVPLAAAGSATYQVATTMTLTGIVACQVAAVMCCRTDSESLFKTNIWDNKIILLGIVAEISLLIIMMYVPGIGNVFGIKPLHPEQWFFAFSWLPILIGLDELRKFIIRKRRRLISQQQAR